jgi:hypothetical protein
MGRREVAVCDLAPADIPILEELMHELS